MNQTCGTGIRLLVFLSITVVAQSAVALGQIKRLEAASTRPFAVACVVDDVPLVHTSLILPTLTAADMPLEQQVSSTLRNLADRLASAGTSAEHVVRVNVSIRNQELASEVLAELDRQWPMPRMLRPCISPVISRTPDPDALLGIDVIAVQPSRAEKLPLETNSQSKVQRNQDWSVLPEGARLYVSGQAESSAQLAQATLSTLEGLERTLESLGRSSEDIVQLKAFVMPMADVGVVQSKVQEFFDGTHPPLVAVEWKSGQTTPIEIELVAWGGPANPNAPIVEHLWVPWLTKSPVYCRVARINRGRTVYTGGIQAERLQAASVSDPAELAEYEVNSIFQQLKKIMESADSNMNHLVKATYFVSTESASQKLNELRPRIYDPLHPPAASKAMVLGMPVQQSGLSIDMIAAPASN
ncbi:MAG: RidA family protein [Planctomycetaceae bacterium]|nr:RidA family protein [Planctomycetaceae bacterium]